MEVFGESEGEGGEGGSGGGREAGAGSRIVSSRCRIIILTVIWFGWLYRRIDKYPTSINIEPAAQETPWRRPINV